LIKKLTWGIGIGKGKGKGKKKKTWSTHGKEYKKPWQS
jgi:hypothetical protein